MSNNLPDSVWLEIKTLLKAGRRIEAIKLYREHSGLGLAEAKRDMDRLFEELHAPAEQPAGKPDLAQIHEALFQNRKIEAIKLYRLMSGSGLKEAKDAVDKMEIELRASSPASFTFAKGEPAKVGCTGVLVLVTAVAMLLAGL
ncbi:MAG TPA: ribosomal protein L7/L12 [Planctomycetota bacterium]|nr:ribosomal protein L7/L12 [Planctomycetota bacterium]